MTSSYTASKALKSCLILLWNINDEIKNNKKIREVIDNDFKELYLSNVDKYSFFIEELEKSNERLYRYLNQAMNEFKKCIEFDKKIYSAILDPDDITEL